jgi:hypothetical protein
MEQDVLKVNVAHEREVSRAAPVRVSRLSGHELRADQRSIRS